MVFSLGVLSISCDNTVNATQGQNVSICIECPSTLHIDGNSYNHETELPPNYSYDVSTMTLILAATCEQDDDIVKWHVSGQRQTTCVHVHVAGL